MKTKEEKIVASVAESIRRELSYTNGWWIPQADYEKHCHKVAKRIVKRLLKTNP